MKYELLLFDADHTLFDFDASEREALEKTMRSFGLPYESSVHLSAYKQINTEVWKAFELGEMTQETLKTERFKRLADRFSFQFSPSEFSDQYMKHLAEAAIIFEESFPVLSALKPTHRMAIVTNGLARVQNGRMSRSSIAPFFEALFISEEMGVAKPNPEFFFKALRALNFADKSKALVIGDSLSSDIQGGINAGIDTCWYNPKFLENKSGLTPTYEIHTLSELTRLI
ncbi:MAG: 2-haloacid dehalogenase [Clostridiales bacterium]|nr:2-haloacid dehalogenase [Clostridiales bacterium]